jgi:hypothetical protein
MAQTIVKQPQDIRVSASGIRPLHELSWVNRSRQFGQHIRDRYLHVQQSPFASPEQILKQSGVILNSVHQHHSVHLRPHLSFTVLHRQSVLSHSIDSAPTPPASNRITTAPTKQYPLTFRRITQPERLIEQIETRRERVERRTMSQFVISTVQSQKTAIRTAPIQEVPLLVVKSSPKALRQPVSESTVARPLAPTVDNETLMAPRAIQPKPSGQIGQPLGAIDVNRLTDQVVQAIDRRLLAHRERMGRI